MITFQHLTIDNFLSFEHVDLDLAGHGLVVIVGENQDHGGSNGAGKTALCEAIHWGLYGTTLRRASVAEVVRIGQNHCSVTVSFTIDGHAYTVTRTRNTKTTLEVAIGGILQPRATIALTQAIIDDVLPPRVFRNTVLFGPGLPRFMRVTDAERKALVLEMLDVDFSAAHQRAKERRVAAAAELADQQAAIRSTEQALARTQSQLEAVKVDQDRQVQAWQRNIEIWQHQLAAVQKEHTAAAASLSDANTQVTAAEDASRAVQGELQELMAQHGAAAQAWSEQGKRIEDLTRQLAQAETNKDRQVLSWATAMEEAKAALRKAEDGILETQKGEADLTGQVASTQELIAAEEEALRAIHEQEASVKAAQNVHDEQIEILEKAIASELTTCPTCGQKASPKALTRSLEKAKEARQDCEQQLYRLVQEDMKHHPRLGEATKRLQALNLTLANVRKTRTSIERDHSMAQQRLSIESPAPALDTAIALLAAQLPALQAEYADGQATIPAMLARIQSLKVQMSDAQKALDLRQRTASGYLQAVTRIEGDIRVLEQKLQTPSPAVALAAALESIEKNRAELTASLSAAQSALPAIEAKLHEYATWEQAFHKDGCPAIALAELTGRLRDAAAHYAAELSGGALQLSLGVDNDALVVHASLDGTAPSYDLLSEGWRARADLAVFLACHSLAGQSNLLCVDEALDAIDQVGLGLLLKVLVGRTGGEGSVFVISHRDDVKEALRSSSGLSAKELVVVLAEGYSTVEWGA